ncbi:MAG: EamA family transporter [Patescibacteria group bacterium]|jgi:transporter family protein
MSWVIYAILSAVFAALVAIFGKVGIANVDSTLATAVRAIVMAIFLVIVTLSLGKYHLLSSINNKALLFIVLSGIAGAISWIFYFFALKNGPASGVAALDRLSVVFVLILAVLFLSQHLTWKAGIGAILLTAGAIMMSIK